MYSPTLPSTSVLDGGVGGQHHAPAALPKGKTRYPLHRRLGGPQGRSGRVRKISPPPTRIRSPDRPVRSESLSRPTYKSKIPQFFTCTQISAKFWLAQTWRVLSFSRLWWWRFKSWGMLSHLEESECLCLQGRSSQEAEKNPSSQLPVDGVVSSGKAPVVFFFLPRFWYLRLYWRVWNTAQWTLSILSFAPQRKTQKLAIVRQRASGMEEIRKNAAMRTVLRRRGCACCLISSTLHLLCTVVYEEFNCSVIKDYSD